MSIYRHVRMDVLAIQYLNALLKVQWEDITWSNDKCGVFGKLR